MKKIFCVLLSIIMLSCVLTAVGFNAYAEDTQNSEFTYAVDSEGNAKITGYKGNGFDVKIPEELDGHTVTKIADNVFKEPFYDYLDMSYVSVIRTITIPSTIKTIGIYNFYDLPYLNNIFVDENNESYTSVDGVLFNKDKTKLINYPTARLGNSYSIPKGVKTIGIYAFYGCKYLTGVIISNGVKTVQEMAFFDCEDITSIYVPKSVTKIGDYAFGCKLIYYSGYYDPKGDYDYEDWAPSEQLDESDIIPQKDFILYGEKKSAAQKYCKKSETKFFTTKGDKVTFKAVDLKKPTLTAKGKKGKFTFAVSWNENVSEYDIQYIKGKKKWTENYAAFGKEYVKNNKYTRTFNKMQKGTYKIKIRAKLYFGGKMFYTPWSKTVKIKIK